MVQLWEHKLLWSNQCVREFSGYFPDSNEETSFPELQLNTTTKSPMTCIYDRYDSNDEETCIIFSCAPIRHHNQITNDLYIWSIGSHFRHDLSWTLVLQIFPRFYLIGWLVRTTASWIWRISRIWSDWEKARGGTSSEENWSGEVIRGGGGGVCFRWWLDTRVCFSELEMEKL